MGRSVGVFRRDVGFGTSITADNVARTAAVTLQPAGKRVLSFAAAQAGPTAALDLEARHLVAFAAAQAGASASAILGVRHLVALAGVQAGPTASSWSLELRALLALSATQAGPSTALVLEARHLLALAALQAGPTAAAWSLVQGFALALSATQAGPTASSVALLSRHLAQLTASQGGPSASAALLVRHLLALAAAQAGPAASGWALASVENAVTFTAVQGGPSGSAGLSVEHFLAVAASQRGPSGALILATDVSVACPQPTTELDLELPACVLEVLEELGRVVDWYVQGAGPAIEVRASAPLRVRRGFEPREVSEGSDAEILVAAQGLAVTPALADRVEFDGTRWTVVAVARARAGTSTAVWRVFLEGGHLPATTTPTSMLDADALACALEVIEELGRPLEVDVPASRSFDTTTGEVAEAGVTTYAVTSSPLFDHRIDFDEGASSRRGAARLLLAASGLPFVPRAGLRCRATGLDLRSTAARALYFGSAVVAWEMEIEGAALVTAASTADANELDEDLVDDARDLIAEFGTAVVVVTYGSRDLAEGVVSKTGRTEHCVRAVLSRPRPRANTRFADGEVSRQRGLRATIAADGLAFDPALALSVEDDSDAYRVLSVRPVWTGGRVATYRLELER